MNSTPSLDVDSFCRHWRDGAGHLFTLERIEPDTERGGTCILLHGRSSNCRCDNFFNHDGPHILHADSGEDLAHGYVFGYEPEPQTHADLTRYVSCLLSLDADEWSHLSRIIDDTECDDDLTDWVSVDAAAAIWALRKTNGDSSVAHFDYEPVRVVRDMTFAGHTSAPLIAAAQVARLASGEAVALPTDLSDVQRNDLIDRLLFLDALRASEPV